MDNFESKYSQVERLLSELVEIYKQTPIEKESYLASFTGRFRGFYPEMDIVATNQKEAYKSKILDLIKTIEQNINND